MAASSDTTLASTCAWLVLLTLTAGCEASTPAADGENEELGNGTQSSSSNAEDAE